MGLPFASFLGKFTEQAGGAAIGFGVGVGLSKALDPEATDLAQASWSVHPSLAIDADTVAGIVAENVELLPWGITEAAYTGINPDRFGAILGEVLNAPGIGELLTLWRRGDIEDADFLHGLRKAKLETRWDTALEQLKLDRLDVAIVATAIQRGVLANPGILPVGPPTEVGLVPPMPQVDLDPVDEAAAHGYDKARLEVLARIVGLPPGPHELLELLNRGVIEEADYLRGIAEGNTRNEWAPYLQELARKLLSPHEYAELRLRGWIDDDTMHAGAALSGLNETDTDLLAKLLGRPLSFHQEFIATRRGGVYDGPTDMIEPGFLKSLQQSNVRPEWYNDAWSQREVYPTAFVLRLLTTSGAITGAQAEQILLYEGWNAPLAKQTAAAWVGSQDGGGKAETQAQLADEFAGGFITEAEYRSALTALGYTGHTQDLLVHLGDAQRLKRYREKAVDAINGAYTNFKINDTQAVSELAELGVTGTAQTMLLMVWGKQRLDTIRLLTPAQIKKAYSAGLITEAVALQSLEWEHMTAADAATFLAE